MTEGDETGKTIADDMADSDIEEANVTPVVVGADHTGLRQDLGDTVLDTRRRRRHLHRFPMGRRHVVPAEQPLLVPLRSGPPRHLRVPGQESGQ